MTEEPQVTLKTETPLQKQRKILSKLNRHPSTQKDYLDNLPVVLELFGYSDLRPNQRDAIFHLFTGQDLLFVCATGSGKSFCYVAPALCMGLRTVVFSPLISLIQNQSDILREKGLHVGVISSAVTPKERTLAMALWEKGELDFLFIAPERLSSDSFMDTMKNYPPDFVVVDEIHCASQYGDNFRAAYKKIAPFIDELKPRLFLGLTATMSEEVETDVRNIFNMQDTTKLCKAYKRENLHFTSVKLIDDNGMGDAIVYRECCEPSKYSKKLVPTIIYCSSVAKVEQLYQTFGKSIPGGAMMYHGQMPAATREANQVNFLKGKIRVAFATNAFGMGVDKPDIGKVIFRTVPGTLEELIQGFGRGGRNGCDCECLLIGDYSSISTQEYFIELGYPTKYTIIDFYNALKKLAVKDEDGALLVHNTLKEICNCAGIEYMYSTALIQILTGYNIIQRGTQRLPAKIRMLDMPNKDDSVYNRFRKYMDKIDLLGFLQDDGYITIDLDFLAEEMELSKQTLVKNLKAFADLSFIEYVSSPVAPPIQIIGNIGDLDFQHLSEKRLEKELKLREIIDYIDLPDEQKADYLEEYFNRENHAGC